jgi:hypothetical protein
MLRGFARRASARALTGRAAFFVAGLIDLCSALAKLGQGAMHRDSDELSGSEDVYTGSRPRRRRPPGKAGRGAAYEPNRRRSMKNGESS